MACVIDMCWLMLVLRSRGCVWELSLESNELVTLWSNLNLFLASTYLIQSTWLDEAISAIIAGHNTSVYVRDVIPRATPRCRRKTSK